MLKKAGILVATAAAGLLAVSPLAFAGDEDDDGHRGGHHGSENQVNNVDNERNSQQNGLVNVGDVDAVDDNAVNVCDNSVPIVNLIPVDDVTAALGILGEANATDVTKCDAETGDEINQSNDD